MEYKSEKSIINLLKNNSHYRREDFRGSGNYFNFIFLCGKQYEDSDNRKFIADHIISKKSGIALFAEQIFEEFETLNFDLLTLENLLLGVSSATIIIVESFGSACELGAFSFVDDNLQKLWIINNEKYKGKNSFIEIGPIKKIKNKYPDHVLYENFNEDGIIEVTNEYITALSLLNRRGFNSNAFKVNGKNLVINDLGFIVCLLFDYIRTFKMIIKEHVYDILLTLFEYKGVDCFIINNKPNQIIEKENVKTVFIKLLDLLENAGIVKTKMNKKTSYCIINYEKIKQLGLNPNDYSRHIFKSTFYLFKNNYKEISRIINKEEKEGFQLW